MKMQVGKSVSIIGRGLLSTVAVLGLPSLVMIAYAQERSTELQRGRSTITRESDFQTIFSAPAAEGDIDSSFLTTDRSGSVPAGVSRIQFPNGAANSAAGSDAGSESAIFVGRQSTGKLVAVLNYSIPGPGGASGIALVRLNTNGTIDATFGGAPGGKVTVPVQSPAGTTQHRNPRATKAAMYGDKIVILGQVDFGVADGGSPTNVCQSGMYQASDVLIVMVNADGTLDTNFDGDAGTPGNADGQVRVSSGTCNDNPFGLGLQADGKIVVGESATDVGLFNAMDNSNQQVNNYFVFFRLNTNGTLDTTYDTDATDDGRVRYRTSSAGLPILPLDPLPNNELAASDLVMTLTNKGILVGTGAHSGHGDFLLNRIDDHGIIDMTFAGGAGFVKTHIGATAPGVGQDAIGVQGLFDGLGRLIVGGYATIDPDGVGAQPAEQRLAAARYSVNGVLDTAGYGGGVGYRTVGGFAVTSACNIQTSGRPLYGVEGTGRVILGGQGFCPDAAYSGGTALDLVMTRLTTAGAIDTTFGTSGRVITHFDPSGAPDFAVLPVGGTQQADGKILPYGSINVAFNGEQDMFVARFLNAAPTAANVTVSGRVMGEGGRGLTNARVSISGPDGETRTVVTGRNGRFTFDNIESGMTYVVSIGSRRYSYSPQLISVTDNVSDLVFTPEGGGVR